MTSPQPPTRAELASFIRDQRTLRAFERLFEAVPGDTLALQAIVDEVAAGAQVAADTATAARSDALRLVNHGTDHHAAFYAFSASVIVGGALHRARDPGNNGAEEWAHPAYKYLGIGCRGYSVR